MRRTLARTGSRKNILRAAAVAVEQFEPRRLFCALPGDESTHGLARLTGRGGEIAGLLAGDTPEPRKTTQLVSSVPAALQGDGGENFTESGPEVSETEPNGALSLANTVTVGPSWTTIDGAVSTNNDLDFFKFTLTQRSGVFFDIDSRETGLSTTLDSFLQLFNGTATVDANDDGDDFETFPLSDAGLTPQSFDSALYVDLNPGTYTIRVNSHGFGSAGNYQLKIRADTTYSSTPPVLHSLPGAPATLYLDFDGHAATDVWGTYNAPAFNFSPTATEYTPGERAAIETIWRTVAEDFAAYNINVTTSYVGPFTDGVAHRHVVTNANPSLFNLSAGVLGVARLGSFSGGGTDDNVSWTFAGNYGADSVSHRIGSVATEMGDTASHEFGHALDLWHYGGDDARPHAIMNASLDGARRRRWFAGATSTVQPPVRIQTDVSVIGGSLNGFGFRPDDHGNTAATATAMSFGNGAWVESGVIEKLGDLDTFSFYGSGSTTIAAGLSREHVSDLDVELRVYNSAGTLVATSDPGNSNFGNLTISLPAGTYYAEVRSDGEVGEVGQYQIAVTTGGNASLTVTTTVDEDDGTSNPTAGTGTSLREALHLARTLGGPQTIGFARSLNAGGPATVALSITGDQTFGPSALSVSTNVTIAGTPGGITIARNAAVERLRLFYVTPTGNLTLRNVTLADGRARGGSSGIGGAGAGLGGAIVNAGSLSLIGSTLSNNTATGGSTFGGVGTPSGGGGMGGDATSQLGGGPNGGGNNGNGGFGGGGGANNLNLFAAAGSGGFGGGGGGAIGLITPGTIAGAGGFGAGGASGAVPGAGGFGGGSGGPNNQPGGAGAGFGGAIFNFGGTVTLTNATLSGNAARGGTSAFSPGNHGQGLGGAIFNLNGNVFARFTTIHGNIAPNGGGAVYSLGDNAVATQAGPTLPQTVPGVLGGIAFTSSIFAGSTNGTAVVPDVIQLGRNGGTSLSSGSNNIIQTRSAGDFTGANTTTAQPLLGPLAFNGGPTMTHLPAPNSPALGAGIGVAGVTTDQRGLPRHSNADLGALELPRTSLLVNTAVDEDDLSSDPAMGSGTSLREAIDYANRKAGNDTITFAPGLFSAGAARIELGSSSRMTIKDVLAINGPGAALLTIDGNSHNRIFTVRAQTQLSGMTLLGGVAGYGGAIESNSVLSLALMNITANQATNGGGIASVGTLIVDASTIANNLATGAGGGILIEAASQQTTYTMTRTTVRQNTAAAGAGLALLANGNAASGLVETSTFSGNEATNSGGAIYTQSADGNADLTLVNSTLSANTAAGFGGVADNAAFGNTINLTFRHVTSTGNTSGNVDFPEAVSSYVEGAGTVTTRVEASIFANAGREFFAFTGAPVISLGNNLLNETSDLFTADGDLQDTDPHLAPLADNGGPTQTHALLPNSRAINAAAVINEIGTDQRNVSRPQGLAPDIGAYERQAANAQLSTVAFEFETRQALVFGFTADASPTFGRSSYTLQNLTTGQAIPASTGALSFSADGRQATLVLTNLLPDGDYRLTSGAATLDFLAFAGDANRDRSVNIGDFSTLAARFNQPGTFSQGDFNYSGQVEIGDFSLLASRFNTSLPLGRTAAASGLKAATPFSGQRIVDVLDEEIHVRRDR